MKLTTPDPHPAHPQSHGVPPADHGHDRWMHRLVEHYRAARFEHPHDELVVVFDIDGTIIDTRHLIRHTLLECDRRSGDRDFRSLRVEDITWHEAEIHELLEQLGVAPGRRDEVVEFYTRNLWSHDALLAAHQPYRGVMEVIRWFQLQPRTAVALNTGRPESMRRITLHAMNELGREYRVSFSDELLLMNPHGLGHGVTDAKVAALAELRSRGLRTVAVIDNEPENLEAMADAEPGDEQVLFLHASTIFLSARRSVARSVTGRRYDLQPFVSTDELQGHVELVWGDVTERSDHERWRTASVRWLGVPVRLDPYGRPEIAHRDTPEHQRPELDLDEVLADAAAARRAVRIELQTGGALVERVAGLVRRSSMPGESLWFAGEFHELGERGVRLLRSSLPGATVSCPAEFVAPLVFGALEHALDLLDVLRSWGIDRLSINWAAPRVRELVAELERWGREVDLCGIRDGEALLQASLLLPRSVTASAAALSEPLSPGRAGA